MRERVERRRELASSPSATTRAVEVDEAAPAPVDPRAHLAVRRPTPHVANRALGAPR